MTDMQTRPLLLIALLICLTACAGSGSSTKPPGPEVPPEGELPPTPVNPIEAVPDNSPPLPDDGERSITVDGDVIYVDGEAKGWISSNGFVRDENDRIIGTIGSDHDGTNAWWTFTPYPEGGSQYYFHVEDGRVVINWERTSVDIGWGAPEPPDVNLPENMDMPEPANMNLTPEQRRRVSEARARFKAALK